MSIQENVVTIAVAPEAAFDLAAVPAEIARVGYKPAAMTVQAVGLFEGGSRFAGYPLAAPVHPVPDTKVKVAASVDYSGKELIWTIVRVGS